MDLLNIVILITLCIIVTSICLTILYPVRRQIRAGFATACLAYEIATILYIINSDSLDLETIFSYSGLSLSILGWFLLYDHNIVKLRRMFTFFAIVSTISLIISTIYLRNFDYKM